MAWHHTSGEDCSQFHTNKPCAHNNYEGFWFGSTQHCTLHSLAISFFELDVLPLLGIQCVMKMDFTYSLLLAFTLPLMVCVGSYMAFPSLSVKSDGEKMMLLHERREALSQLFDLSDFDASGDLDLAVRFTIWSILLQTGQPEVDKRKTRELLLESGAKLSSQGESLEVTICREDFLRATTIELLIAPYEENRPAILAREACVKAVSNQKAVTSWFTLRAQILLMFHAPFSSKAFLFFDCEKLGSVTFWGRSFHWML